MGPETRLLLFLSGLALGLACSAGGREWMVASPAVAVVAAPAPGTERAIWTAHSSGGKQWGQLTVQRPGDAGLLAIEVDGARPDEAAPVWTSAERVEVDLGDVTIAVRTSGSDESLP